MIGAEGGPWGLRRKPGVLGCLLLSVSPNTVRWGNLETDAAYRRH
jgi:hypothetical protein